MATPVGAVFRWDGTGWTDLTPPQSNLGEDHAMDIFGSGPDDVRVVGSTSEGARKSREDFYELHHWDGTSWTEFESRGEDWRYTGWSDGPDDVWTFSGRAHHFDDTTWSTERVGGAIHGVAAGSDLWGVGEGGRIYRRRR